MAGEFDDDAHPRDDAGKFTAGGGSAHVSSAQRGGDHAKAKGAHDRAAAKAKDPATRAQHQAASANHAGQAARAEGEKSGLASFAEKHGGDDGHKDAGHGEGPHGAKHEEGHGLGAWVAHKLDEAKEGVHEKGEEARELAEKVIEGDPFKAAEAVAGAAGKATVGRLAAGGHAGKEHGGGGEHH